MEPEADRAAFFPELVAGRHSCRSSIPGDKDSCKQEPSRFCVSFNRVRYTDYMVHMRRFQKSSHTNHETGDGINRAC